jgi:hypothetical protein
MGIHLVFVEQRKLRYLQIDTQKLERYVRKKKRSEMILTSHYPDKAESRSQPT